MTFASLGLPSPILKGVRAAGLTEPTAIQTKAIPVILQGNDLIGAAGSGTGKTAAYLLPLLARLLDGPARLRALILAPTREVAASIAASARDYARYTVLRVGVVFAGAPLAPQERMLREGGIDVLVATAERLLELHGRQCVNFEDIEMLVLDEADRMVDLGMAGDLRRLLKLLPETRQTLLFAGVMPPELNRLSKEALIEPVRVDLGAPTSPAAGITHAIYPVPRALKARLLDEMMARTEARSTIVFSRTRESADRLARQLERRGYTVGALHDHRSQGERERAIEDLKRARVQLLVATDLAARGIDLSGVAHVVNFDVPPTPEDYVHRIGRAGRPDAAGDAFTLMSPEEQRHLAAIERFLGRAIPRVLLPDFDYGEPAPEPPQAPRPQEDRLRRGPGGVQVAAAKIAAVARPSAASVSRKTVPGARPAKPARPKPATGARPAKPARPKPAAGTRPAKPARPKRAARPAKAARARAAARPARVRRTAAARGRARARSAGRHARRRKPASRRPRGAKKRK